MATNKPFSIDISGGWSIVQARKVVEALKPETDALNLELRTVDISMHGSPCRWIITVWCKKHDMPIHENSVCEICLQETRRASVR